MALPIILGGFALVSALVGLGSGASGISTMNDARALVETANAKLEQARGALQRTGESTNKRLAALGERKLQVCDKTLRRVVAVAARVHSGTDAMALPEVRGIAVTPDMVDAMERASFTAGDILGAGASGAATAAMAGYGALGLAGTVGTASTGTAISALSGAAASNATLAWLGGGAVSAGGFGVAGGMAVVSGLAVGPGLAIAGIALAKKAQKSLTEAQEFAAKVDVACEKIRTSEIKVRAIRTRAHYVHAAIRRLDERLQAVLAGAESVLDARGPGRVAFDDLRDHEQQLYKTTLVMGAALYQLIEVDILDEAGEVTAESARTVADADALVRRADSTTLALPEPA